ncbi:hypothetical protein HanXRQr2_Chr03g0088721 [Helianthus annuus]|uniref:Uncharacterized protein n=1 Tax=Helianthus annuus TaxID=4232 RepID=A0A251V458_HELAN|nr:hypothetical protein HanXRQr2_Chr03g0088721 [Helianthus annuus]KAJ0606456.1 hypothetical protein HanHA89_Chr03g0085311 [Helianthus annuus]
MVYVSFLSDVTCLTTWGIIYTEGIVRIFYDAWFYSAKQPLRFLGTCHAGTYAMETEIWFSLQTIGIPHFCQFI